MKYAVMPASAKQKANDHVNLNIKRFIHSFISSSPIMHIFDRVRLLILIKFTLAYIFLFNQFVTS